MNDSDSPKDQKPQSSPARTVAEWTTLLVSALIVGGLAVFLIFDAMRPQSELIGVQARVELQRVEKRGQLWVLPIEVRNLDRRNVSELQIEVTWREKGREQSRDIAMQYLSEGASKRAYVWFESDPRELKVEATPTWYRLY